MADVKNNLRATSFPQVTDDSSAGYSKGSTWYCDGRVFVCDDATAGAAKWYFLAPEDAWPSATMLYPANFGAMASMTPTDLTKDVAAWFPFVMNGIPKTAQFNITAAGAGGTMLAANLFAHDYTTGGPSKTRLVQFGGGSIDGYTGIKGFGGNVTTVVRGLVWLMVHIKLNGVTAAPTFAGMTQGNGRHVHTTNPAGELADFKPRTAYTSNDAYNASGAGTAGSANLPVIPMPLILRA